LKGQCFKQCENEIPYDSDAGLPYGSSAFDYYSTKFFGWKTLRKKQYTPCQDKCIQESHWTCTENNWQRGGERSFKLYGRWAMKRIFVFEEFVSMVLCALSVVQNIFLLRKYYDTVSTKSGVIYGEYGFEGVFIAYYCFWMFAFFCAMLFHTKDTPLTEKLDYFSAFWAVMYGLYSAFIRVTWVVDTGKRLLIGIPFILYTLYHFYYMTFISFDYGYNVLVIVVVGVLHSILWISWMFKTRLPHMWKNLATQLAVWAMSTVEVYDFPPLFGYLDAHAIWHACVLLVAFLWIRFLVADAQYYLRKKVD